MLRHNSDVASYTTFLAHPLKLISSLLESPPPDIAAAPGSASATTAAEAVKTVAAAPLPTPAGICGSIPSETGTPDWVCHAFGQVMPGLVFFVSMIVIAMTLIFLVRYFYRCLKAAGELKFLLDALNQYKSLAPHEIASPAHMKPVMTALTISGERLPALAPFTRKVEDSLIQIGPASEGQVLSKPVSEIAEKNNGIYAWTGKNLADEIPNWLTAIGLLTTFIAILLGLQHVKVLTNLEVQGISGLVNGLSGKFFSSIVALACALSVTVTNHFCSEMLRRLWSEILLKLEALIPHLSTEQMLFDLLRDRQRKKTEP